MVLCLPPPLHQSKPCLVHLGPLTVEVFLHLSLAGQSLPSGGLYGPGMSCWCCCLCSSSPARCCCRCLSGWCCCCSTPLSLSFTISFPWSCSRRGDCCCPAFRGHIVDIICKVLEVCPICLTHGASRRPAGCGRGCCRRPGLGRGWLGCPGGSSCCSGSCQGNGIGDGGSGG